MYPLRLTAPLSALTLGLGIAFTLHYSDAASSAARAHRLAMPDRVAVYVPSTAVHWVPLSMSMEGLPLARLRHYQHGSLVLHLTIGANGHVSAASLVESSGDDVIDEDALQLARRWRFAVPANHPRGFSADLPLHFAGV